MFRPRTLAPKPASRTVVTVKTWADQRAMTLVEMIAALLLVSVLATVGVLSYQRTQNNAKDLAAVEVVRSVAAQAQELASTSEQRSFTTTGLRRAVDALPARDSSGTTFAATSAASQGFGQVSVPDPAAATEVTVAMLSSTGKCVTAVASTRGAVTTSVASSGECRGSYTADTSTLAALTDPTVAQVLGLTAIAGNGSARLNWAASTDPAVAGYRIYRDGQMATATSSRTTVTVDVDGLTNGELYTFVVAAFTATGAEGPVSASVSVRPMDAPEAATPIVLTATGGDRRVTLTWAGVGASSYQVLRDDTRIATVTTTGYVDTDDALIPGRAYTYRLVGYNQSGTKTAESNSAAAAPTGLTAPQQPASATAVGGISQVTVSWNTVTGATSYDVRYASGATIATQVAALSRVVGGLSAATTYRFEVRACNAIGCAPWSQPASALTAPAAPAATATATGLSIAVSWNAPTSATRYEWQRRTGTGAFGASTSQTTTAITDTAVSAGTTYGYQIRACNASACSSWSATVSATTRPAAPVLSGSATQTTASLSWSVPATATRYEVTRADAGVQASTITTASWSQSGLAAATTYTYTVKACNAAGCSPASNAASVSTIPTGVLFSGGCDPFGGSYAGDTSGRCSASWAGAVTTSYRITWTASGLASSPTYTTTSNTGGPWQGYLGDNTVAVQACNAAGCAPTQGYTLPGAPRPSAVLVNPDGCLFGYCNFTMSATWATSYEVQFTQGSNGLVYCSNGCWGNSQPGLWSSSWYPTGTDWTMHANGCSTTAGGCPATVSMRQYFGAFANAVVRVQPSNFYYCAPTDYNTAPTLRCAAPVQSAQ
jgi:prepilin-type N-terminal cleavage/methylation domain-containing protein